MSKVLQLITVIGLPLLVVGCSEESSPPSAPQAEPRPQHAATPSFAATTAMTKTRYRVRGEAVEAEFLNISGPTGCLFTHVELAFFENATKESAGKPTSGTFADVDVIQYDGCIGGIFHEVAVFANEPLKLQIKGRVAEANVQATLPAFDFATGAEVTVEVDLTFPATGGPGVSSGDQFTTHVAGSYLSRSRFSGIFREVTATGTVSIAGENFTPDPQLLRGFPASGRASWNSFGPGRACPLLSRSGSKPITVPPTPCGSRRSILGPVK